MTGCDVNRSWCQVRGECRDDPLPPSLLRSTPPQVDADVHHPWGPRTSQNASGYPCCTRDVTGAPDTKSSGRPRMEGPRQAWSCGVDSFRHSIPRPQLELGGVLVAVDEDARCGVDGSECDGTGTYRPSRRIEESMLFLDHGTTSPSRGLGRVTLTVTPATAWSSTGMLAVGRRAVLAVRHDPVPVRRRLF